MIYYKSLKLHTDPDVYEPAEDSYLLSESVVVDTDETVLDVGTGTGIVALASASHASTILGVDVNERAVELACQNAQENSITNAEFRLSDMFSNVSSKYDVISFNPPYLPVSDDGALAKSWSGGEDGIKIVMRFLSNVSDYMKPDGRFYLLISSLNDIESVRMICLEHGLIFEPVSERKIPFETLTVFCGNLIKQ